MIDSLARFLAVATVATVAAGCLSDPSSNSTDKNTESVSKTHQSAKTGTATQAKTKPGYNPTLKLDPPVPKPPAEVVRDFKTFLTRLKSTGKKSPESLVLHKDALKLAEAVFRDSVGVPAKIRLEQHRPFFAVNPEGFFGLYADLPTLERGLVLFQQNCASCHGPYGRGNGAATRLWYSGNLPRNFTYGKYKSRSTKYGSIPTDSDLFRTLTRGLYGSTMPSFRHLSARDRWCLVQFLKTLANYYDDFDESVVNRFDRSAEDMKSDLFAIEIEPPVTQAGVNRGRVLFIKQGCVQCHQEKKPKPTGLARSDGKFNWRDEMDRPIHHSRDLTTQVYLAGAASSDLYRIITGGPNVGPMPSYKNLPPADRWALIHYVQSLYTPRYPQAPPTVDALAKPPKN